MSHIPFKKCVKDFLATFLLACAIFYPLMGFVLNGFELEIKPYRPLVPALSMAVIRTFFLYGLQPFLQNQWQKSGAQRVEKKEKTALLAIVILIATICFTLMVPFLFSNYWLNVGILCLIYILLALGLNIVVGYAGLLDLGFVGFYAVGAYTFGILSSYTGLGFWSVLPLAALVAAGFGILLGFPVLRMHGDYLAIVTLGFGEIIRLILNNWTELTGGPNGMRIPPLTFFGIEFTRRSKYGGPLFHELFSLEYSSATRFQLLYLVILAFTCLVAYISWRLPKIAIGRSLLALREDEIACRSLGINHVGTKLMAFASGASIAGVAGVFFGAQQRFINPTSFTFFESALILAIVVLGGLGSTVGVIIAAVVMTALPELLRDFSEYRVLLFGLLMVIMMIAKPQGLVRQKYSQYTFE